MKRPVTWIITHDVKYGDFPEDHEVWGNPQVLEEWVSTRQVITKIERSPFCK